MTLVPTQPKKIYIYVNELIHVTGVSLDKSSISLTTVGQTEQLTATITPNNADDQTVVWSSSDTNIATVDQTGLVTCVTPGTATITVTTNDGGYTASCGVYGTNTLFRYIKWSISNNRANNPSSYSLQMAEFKLYDGANELSRPTGTTCACNQSYISNEGPAKLIDGSVYTKFNTGDHFTVPCELTIDVGSGNEIDFSVYNEYRWYTANDYPERDPITWTLSLSNDGNNWETVSTVTNETITSSRYALAGTWNITV